MHIAAIYGLKLYPFFLGIAFALLGFMISWLIVKDTRKFTLLEIKENQEGSRFFSIVTFSVNIVIVIM